MDYGLASTADREALAVLLDAERLPSSDLAASGVALIAAKAGDQLVGCIGIEARGEAGIIRSLVVVPGYRDQGIARSLVSRAEALARERGVRRLYLLTEGASGFWRKAGYAVADRAEAPAAIRESAEFASLCSASAICMKRLLSAPMDRG